MDGRVRSRRRSALVAALCAGAMLSVCAPPPARADDAPPTDLAALEKSAEESFAAKEYAVAARTLAAALAERERVSGRDAVSLLPWIEGWGRRLAEAGRHAEALPFYERSLEIAEAAHGPVSPAAGNRLNDLAMRCQALGRLDEARALLERSLAIAERTRGPTHMTTARRLVNLADVLEEQERFETALPHFRRALAIAEEVSGPEDEKTGGYAARLGALLGAMELGAEARPLLERALAIAEKVHGPEHRATADRQYQLARCLSDSGEHGAARPLYERAIATAERVAGPRHATTGLYLNDLGSLLTEKGEHAAAIPLLERAVSIAEETRGPGHRVTGVRLANLALALEGLGRNASARPLRERALAIAVRVHGRESPATAARHAALGGVLHDLGDFDGAKAQFERALGITESSGMAEGALAALRLEDLAGSLMDLGQYEASRRLFERAVTIRRRVHGPVHPSTVKALTRLTAVLLRLGEYAEAKGIAERLLALAEVGFGPNHRYTGLALQSLALVHHRSGRPAEALPLYERAIAILGPEMGLDGLGTAISLELSGDAWRLLGDPGRARPLFERALEIRERTLGPEHALTVYTVNNLAAALAAAGDAERAAPLFARAMDTAERNVTRMLLGAPGPSRLMLADMIRRHGALFLEATGRLGVSGYPETLRFKGLVSRIEAAERRLALEAGEAGTARVEALQGTQRRLAALANSVPPAREAERLRLWQEQFAALTAERDAASQALTDDFARYRQGLARLRIGLVDVRAGLGKDGVLVDYLRLGGRYHAWVVRAGIEVLKFDLGPAAAIEEAAEAFVEATRKAENPEDERWLASGKALRDLVIAPLAAHVGDGAQRLYVSPDAALAAVPFAALPGIRPGRLLGEDLSLALVTMAQDLVPWEGEPPPGRGALLVGGVAFDVGDPAPPTSSAEPLAAPPAPPVSRGLRAPVGRSFLPLPATLAEVEGLRKSIGESASLLTGADASEARLREGARSRRIVHVATHGFVRTDLRSALAPPAEKERWLGGIGEARLAGYDPMLLAGLALAGANPRRGGGDDDGILTALEASYLDLRGCELVVLSACETALGKAESGEGVLGLVQGFQMAGARDVVASLWKVDDVATHLLMERLYSGLLSEERPLPPDEALRAASRAVRDDPRFQAPRFWAAFVAYVRR